MSVRLGVIGAWGHFVHVLKDAESMPGVEVVGLAPGHPDEDFSKVQAQCPSTSNAQVYDDYRKLLRDQSPDVVTVSTRLDLIAPLAVAAAEAGCHIVCEKPLAITHEGLERLWAAVNGNGVQCYAMMASRAHPLLAAGRKAVADGLIGEVCLLNARKSYRFGDRPEWFGWRDTYGGTIPWIGIHALDFIDAVTDSAFTSVAAMHTNAAHPERPECEDVCTLTLGLANGALATASIDYLRPRVADSHGDDWLRIVGSKGIIEIGMGRNEATIMTDGEALRDLPGVAVEPYYAALLRELPCAGDGVPDDTTRRAFALTHAALCVRDSADSGEFLQIAAAPWGGIAAR